MVDHLDTVIGRTGATRDAHFLEDLNRDVSGGKIFINSSGSENVGRDQYSSGRFT